MRPVIGVENIYGRVIEQLDNLPTSKGVVALVEQIGQWVEEQHVQLNYCSQKWLVVLVELS